MTEGSCCQRKHNQTRCRTVYWRGACGGGHKGRECQRIHPSDPQSSLALCKPQEDTSLTLRTPNWWMDDRTWPVAPWFHYSFLPLLHADSIRIHKTVTQNSALVATGPEKCYGHGHSGQRHTSRQTVRHWANV